MGAIYALLFGVTTLFCLITASFAQNVTDPCSSISGKYFKLRSAMNGKVVSVPGGEGPFPGAGLIVWVEKHAEDRQLWFKSPINGAIRSKHSPELCMDITDDDHVILMPCVANDVHSQTWIVDGSTYVFQKNNLVLDIASNDMANGAKLVVWHYGETSNQHWEVFYLPPEYFIIQSVMSQRVLDVYLGLAAAGTKLIMWKKKAIVQDNQLFYENRCGYLFSKLNNYALDTPDGTLRIQPYTLGSITQRLVYDDRSQAIFHLDDRNQVLDIKMADHSLGTEIVSWKWLGSSNQKWILDTFH